MPEEIPIAGGQGARVTTDGRTAKFFGNPQVGVAPAKARRHDADQSPRSVIQHESLIDDAGIGAKLFDPSFVTHDENWRSAGLVVGWLHHAAEQRRHAEKFKGSGRNQIGVEPLGPFDRMVENVEV